MATRSETLAERIPGAALPVVLLGIGTACVGNIGDSGAKPGATASCGAGETCVAHADPGVRLLTRYEYDRSVRDLLGLDEALAEHVMSPDPSNAVGFENGHTWSLSDLSVERYLDIAEKLAEKAIATRWEALVPCDRSGAPGCGPAFVDAFLPKVFRRPPSAEERDPLVALLTAAEAEDGFETAARLTLTATLMSPQFLYQIESDHEQRAGDVATLDGYEVASRLAYFLWGSTPDDALFAAAKSGGLGPSRDLELEVRRMLADPRAEDTVRTFHHQWLKLDILQQVEKDETRFPEFDNATAPAALYNGLQAFLTRAFDGGLDELTGSRTVYLTPSLAPLYGVAPQGEGLEPYELGAGERAGFLTQPGLLAMLAHPNNHSPILRGVFLRRKILCGDIPPPPPGVAIMVPQPSPDATTRERYTNATSNPACVGCHGIINPGGFLFEHYDSLGRFREEENGKPVDAHGEIIGLGDPSLEGELPDALALAGRLGESAQFRGCLTRQWVRFAVRGPETATDQGLIDRAATALEDSGGDFREMLVAIATSDAMRFRRIPEP